MNPLLLWLIIVAVFAHFNRSRIEVQYPIILVKYKELNRIIYESTRKWKKVLDPLSDVGILIGILGMLFAFFLMARGAFSIIAGAQSESQVSIVIPGVRIPGSPIFIPFLSRPR